MSKILIWDTESTDLYATWGRLLCFTWIDLAENKPHILRISDYPEFKKDSTDDSRLVKDALSILAGADMWFTWYGTRHDVPLVNSRAVKHGLPILPPIPHVDGWRVSKYNLRLPSNRLASVSSFLELPEKTPIKSDMWVRARAGYMNGLKYVYAHGLQDVVVTREVYKRMRPLIREHPNVSHMNGVANGCPSCGGVKVQKRGVTVSLKRVKQRYWCPTCGSWSSSRGFTFDQWRTSGKHGPTSI